MPLALSLAAAPLAFALAFAVELASELASELAPEVASKRVMWQPSSVEGEPLQPQRRYTALHRSPVIDLRTDREGDRSLVLLEHDGTPIVRVDGVRDGAVDLNAVVPEIWELANSAWLQLLVDDEPTGAALVVQPLRDRPALRTIRATRPDGTTRYTRVVGWGTEPLDPINEEEAKLAESWSTEGSDEEEPPLSGVRIYVERDVLLETVWGTIRIALRPDEAPNTAWNFRELAEGGLYDGTVFHRVVPLDRGGQPFVVQGGDPSRTGTGGPGRTLPLEPSRLAHDFGVVSMARADDPDSAGSQFFICLSRAGTARLDGQYCAFGEVVDGVEAVLAIEATEIADPAAGRPVDPPLVLRATLDTAPPRTPERGRADRRIERPQPREREVTPSGHDPR